MDEIIDNYLAENPQDGMIFEEVFARADMNSEEMSVFWLAIGRFFEVVLVHQLDALTSSIPDLADIPDDVTIEDPDE